MRWIIWLAVHVLSWLRQVLTVMLFTSRFTAASAAEVMRNSLDSLQQAGAALQELCMRFCEALADSIIQQLLAKPMSLLQNANYNLSEAEYGAMEVLCSHCQAHIRVCSTMLEYVSQSSSRGTCHRGLEDVHAHLLANSMSCSRAVALTYLLPSGGRRDSPC